MSDRSEVARLRMALRWVVMMLDGIVCATEPDQKFVNWTREGARTALLPPKARRLARARGRRGR